jgi:hypothetical protein
MPGGKVSRLELLRGLAVGERIAENELEQLASYFVETDQWNRIYRGEVDIVKGEKGSGKSAIYSLLVQRADDLSQKSIILVSAENPRGNPAFKQLRGDLPTSEAEFVGMWKLYIIVLIAERLRALRAKGKHVGLLLRPLEDQGLLRKDESKIDLTAKLKHVREYVRRWLHPTFETGMSIDPATGLATYNAKITPGEPSASQKTDGCISIDELFEHANQALADVRLKVWILLDRLDVAFASEEIERNALRALFKTYLDISGRENIKLKVFLRSDIWEQIVDGGFREASHLTKDVTLSWSHDALLNLIVKRLLKNKVVREAYKIDDETVKSIESDLAQQKALFYQIYPRQVEQGKRKPETLEWMVSRCADGTKKTAPREIIHLLMSLKDEEIARLQLGGAPCDGVQLFDRAVFKPAQKSVSTARLVQTLYAEYDHLRRYLNQLKGKKTEQTKASLVEIWRCSENEADHVIAEAVRVGFFEVRGSTGRPTYWVPFLYRSALEMVQGTAS